MSPRFLLVDGYNLIHAAGMARKSYGPGDLERIRLQLLVKLGRRLTSEERQRCTVIFDAIEAPSGLPTRFRHEEIQVRFAEPGHDADELIEALIQQHSSPGHLTVVSSDHRLQNAIRRRKGKSIDSDDFIRHLESPHRRLVSQDRPKNAKPDPTDELDFWVHEFVDVNPNSIQESVGRENPEPKSEWDQSVEQLDQLLQDSKQLDEWLDDDDDQPSHGTKKKR